MLCELLKNLQNEIGRRALARLFQLHGQIHSTAGYMTLKESSLVVLVRGIFSLIQSMVSGNGAS